MANFPKIMVNSQKIIVNFREATAKANNFQDKEVKVEISKRKATIGNKDHQTRQNKLVSLTVKKIIEMMKMNNKKYKLAKETHYLR